MRYNATITSTEHVFPQITAAHQMPFSTTGERLAAPVSLISTRTAMSITPRASSGHAANLKLGLPAPIVLSSSIRGLLAFTSLDRELRIQSSIYPCHEQFVIHG